MDFFGKDQFKELLRVQQGPAVSIFVRADRQDIKGKNNQIAFRNQVDKAKKVLEEHYPDEEFRPIEQMMDEWIDDEAFWGTLTKGAAAFFAPDIERVYRVDADVDTEAVVGDSFHTRPMLRPMLAPRRYWVLALDQKNTKLYEATHDEIEPVSLGDIPTSLDQALQLDYPSRPLRHREGGVSRSTPAFQAIDNDRDLEPRHFREFSQIVDKGLCELLQNADGPLILAASPKMYSIFREESNLANLADEGLAESVVHLRPAQIHAKTWPLAKQAAEAKIDEILELWERSYGFGKGESDLQQIAKRTLMSQVRFLLIEDERKIWGELDRDQGTVDITGEGLEQADRGGIDLLDDLAEFVIAMGGEVFVLPQERMPVGTGAAAILRGSGRAEYGGEGARMT